MGNDLLPPPTWASLAKEIHEARILRGAKKESPGIIRQTLDSMLKNGQEPRKGADLTKLERDEQVAEWIKITERVSAQVAAKPHGGRPEGGVRAAARELGHRAVKVASLSDEAKEAAREVGLDNNRSAVELRI